MWLKILIRILPIERIVAACLDYLLRKLEKKADERLEKSAKRIIEASVAFKDCVDDPTGAGKPSREAVSAWAKGMKTPDTWRR